MRTLARVALDTTTAGEPLPIVFKTLADAGMKPRRGTVTMLAAPPGAMKTFLVTKWVQAMKQTTLFFSADTDANTILERACAVVTGDTQHDVAMNLSEGGEEYYADILREKAGHIRWVFESDPTYKDLELEITAFAEVYGDFPKVIVIDNLMNVVGENENEWGAMRDTTRALHRVVRLTGASLFILHHMSENKANPVYPAPRKDLQGKVSQLPEMILSIAFDPSLNMLRVSAVKNRWGRADASAESYVCLYIDPERGQFYNTRQEMELGYAI